MNNTDFPLMEQWIQTTMWKQSHDPDEQQTVVATVVQVEAV